MDIPKHCLIKKIILPLFFILFLTTHFAQSNESDPIAKIYNVVLKFGYQPEIAQEIAQKLLPYYDKLQIRDINNQDLLLEDLKNDITILDNDFQDRIDLFSLLVDANAGNFIKEKLGHLDSLNEQEKGLVVTPLGCVYNSILGSILLESKGLNVVVVSTLDKDNIKRFASHLPGWLEPFDPVVRWFSGSKIVEIADGHMLCMVKLNDDKDVFVDFTLKYITQPLALKDLYTSEGNKFNLKFNYFDQNFIKNFEVIDRPRMIVELTRNVEKAYEYWGLIPESIKYHEHDIQMMPNWDSLYYETAAQYLRLKQFDKAIQYVKKGIEIDPFSTDAAQGYFLLGTSYLGIAREQATSNSAQPGSAQIPADIYYKAVENFKKSINVDPEFALAYETLGLLYQQENGAESKEYLEKAKELYEKQNNMEKVRGIEKILETS